MEVRLEAVKKGVRRRCAVGGKYGTNKKGHALEQEAEGIKQTEREKI